MMADVRGFGVRQLITRHSSNRTQSCFFEVSGALSSPCIAIAKQVQAEVHNLTQMKYSHNLNTLALTCKLANALGEVALI